jgi:acetyl-CoA carboxylase biotin carboxyl carrier protein
VADPKSSPHPFDVRTVEHLIDLMARHDLTEIALQEGEQRIRLRKGGAPVYVPAASAPIAVPLPTAGATPPAATEPAKKYAEIKSEMVGTFYAKPKPDKDDYVKVGSVVKPDTVVCQIEAMKIFNEVPAGIAGTIAEVCVKNGEFVEFGTVLFRMDQ